MRPGTPCFCGGGYSIGNYRIPCFRGTVHGRLSFGDALARSCNVTFARVGARLGAERLLAQAERFGLGKPIAGDLETARTLIPKRGERLRRSLVAQVAFGQGPLAVTPLQMAMIGAAIANDGVMREPSLVHSVISPEGRLVARPAPRGGHRAMRPETAAALRTIMARGVAAGTGGRARLPGVTVAGKTGTAQNPHGEDHAWFVGLAPAEKPRVVVAVLVEHGGIGGRVAAPVAREVLAAALGIQLTPDGNAATGRLRGTPVRSGTYRARAGRQGGARRRRYRRAPRIRRHRSPALVAPAPLQGPPAPPSGPGPLSQ
jgi:peptidoglycan glycosyltransferase